MMQSDVGAKGAMTPDRSSHELEPLLQHLAHDLRQPLSGIESIAYYLEMVLAGAEPEIGQHCQRLRRMVQQANWILNDASLAAHMAQAEPAPLNLRDYFSRLGARLALQEECSLELHLAGALPQISVPALAPRLFDHLLAFVRDVAQSGDPIRVFAAAEDRYVRLTLHAHTETDPADLLRILETPSPASGVRCFFEACGGSLASTVSGGVLTLSMLLPAVEQV